MRRAATDLREEINNCSKDALMYCQGQCGGHLMYSRFPVVEQVIDGVNQRVRSEVCRVCTNKMHQKGVSNEIK